MGLDLRRIARSWRNLFTAPAAPVRPVTRSNGSERILLVRPDTYGDLILFEPAVRILLEARPRAEIAMLVRRAYLDLAPLFPAGLRWLPLTCEPYRKLPSAGDPEIDELRHVVEEFDPHLVVGGCYSATWVEYLVAAFAPQARHVRLGDAPLEIGSAQAAVATLNALFPRRPKQTVRGLEALFPDRVALPEEMPEVGKGHALIGGILGQSPHATVPRLLLPEATEREVEGQLAVWGLREEGYLVVCPAGTANVAIKAWPPARFGEIIAWAEKSHGLPSLVLGGQPEREVLEATAEQARIMGAQQTVVHAGERGTFPFFATLLGRSRAYLGNDTGALHAAAATGRPVLGVFGGGTWPRFRPAASAPAAIAVQPMECFGCGWDCPFGDAPCLSSVPSSLVQEALDWLLGPAALTGECRDFELHTPAGEVESRFLQAARRHRQARSESAARQRQIAELEDRFHAGVPAVPAAPPHPGVPPRADDRDQVVRLRQELRRMHAELKLTRRVLAGFVAQPRPRLRDEP